MTTPLRALARALGNLLRGVALALALGGAARLAVLAALRRRVDRVFPGPVAHVVFGNLLQVAKRDWPAGVFKGVPAWFLSELHERYGSDACRVWMGPGSLHVSVVRPDTVAEVYDKTEAHPAAWDPRSGYLTERSVRYRISDESKDARALYTKAAGSPDALRAVHAATVRTTR